MMNQAQIDPFLIKKYNQPVPRYTSYPTIPFWQDHISLNRWREQFREQFAIENKRSGISLYIHLPFCESLCTYCGCNKKITTNHTVEEPYLLAIAKEWKQYRSLMQETPVIRELHLGGGTPTFFSPKNLERLVTTILSDSTLHPDYEFSIEGHPNNTTAAHLAVLASLGFRRISYGVQDMDPEVQRVINRIQPLANVQRATDEARKKGFTSVNFDLIYGLPLQTVSGMQTTFQQVLPLQPDRIAFYSYAHVPWTSRMQRLFDETQLPAPEEKMQLYLEGKKLLLEGGYEDIGMDHFALPHDELFRAREAGTLHRNFMGYTIQNSSFLLGLGVSAISDIGNAFAQNKKNLHDYYNAINTNQPAVKRGYFLSEEDLSFRHYIKDISCKAGTLFDVKDLEILEQSSFPLLDQLQNDGLITYDRKGVKVTPMGHYFIRTICSAFDLYLQRHTATDNNELFSKAI
ncbi:oxygen-independent coproporphyrinogen III oxidase [Niabella pedocola]|uniref:Coproporphyrinogen-III oxidase n=1 Tax=Niabella pedocola TaxID=1752077 RepID=A0ABS8PVP6_9BACT|nr:oxygen-independent coproporphyrinogen III oxidase [Niabella pedocola]MCD2424352.1 oxygen-independent coproporphyrinogen III oxidase [Niabella pedocola]